jgi:hypothetical protein
MGPLILLNDQKAARPGVVEASLGLAAILREPLAGFHGVRHHEREAREMTPPCFPRARGPL